MVYTVEKVIQSFAYFLFWETWINLKANGKMNLKNDELKHIISLYLFIYFLTNKIFYKILKCWRMRCQDF